MSRHDERPRREGELDPRIVAELERLRALPYVQSAQPLQDLVGGLVVRTSLAGRSGFALIFENDSWVLCFLADHVLRWKHGRGQLSPADRALLESLDYGDARLPILGDRPYANEHCDIRAEVARAHGERITGLAFGENSFNFCFPDGRELDTSIVVAADGRPGLRVFWEQW